MVLCLPPRESFAVSNVGWDISSKVRPPWLRPLVLRSWNPGWGRPEVRPSSPQCPQQLTAYLPPPFPSRVHASSLYDSSSLCRTPYTVYVLHTSPTHGQSHPNIPNDTSSTERSTVLHGLNDRTVGQQHRGHTEFPHHSSVSWRELSRRLDVHFKRRLCRNYCAFHLCSVRASTSNAYIKPDQLSTILTTVRQQNK